MKPLLAIAVLGTGVVGLASGVLLVHNDPPAPSGSSAAAEAQARALEQQVEEIRDLRNLVTEIAGRLEMLEVSSVTPRAPVFPSPKPASVAKADLATPPVIGEEMRTAVAAVLREEREIERKQEEERRERQRIEQTERRLDRLSTDLALAPNQKDGMRKIFLEDEERRRDVVDRAARGEVDWRDAGIREEFRSYVDAREQKVQTLLTPEQYEKFGQTPGGNIGRFFGGGGGPEAGGAFWRGLGGDRPRRDRVQEGQSGPR